MWPFSQKKNLSEPSWEGPWTVSQGEYEGSPLFVRVHEGVGRLSEDGTFPEQVGIAVPLNSPNKHGLPTEEEFQQLGKIEDQIVEVLEHGHRTIHVLTITTNGMREFVLYTMDAEGVRKAFPSLKETVSTHDLQLMIQSDPGWSVYKQFVK